MKESKLAKGIIATVAVFAFSVPAVSMAEELKGRSEKVDYTDLDIVKDAGAETLYRRLQAASKRVCGVESLYNAGSLRVLRAQRDCYREALDNAVTKIDNPTLTAIHEG